MLKIKKNTQKWEANYSSKFEELWKSENITARPEVLEKVKYILKNASQIKTNNFGICFHEENPDGLNVLIGAINRVNSTKKDARFYVSTNSQYVMDKFVEANTLDNVLWDHCSIIPNFTGSDFSEKEKTLIDFMCLRNMNQIFSTPNNQYAFAAASAGRGGVYIPHEDDVFIIDRAALIR